MGLDDILKRAILDALVTAFVKEVRRADLHKEVMSFRRCSANFNYTKIIGAEFGDSFGETSNDVAGMVYVSHANVSPN